MAFFTKHFNRLTGKWTPYAKSVSSYDIGRLARDIERESTVSHTDVKAVISALPHVMMRYLAEGHTVRLDGIGTFYLSLQCTNAGVDEPDQVSADQIKNVKVQFRPDMTGPGRKGKRHNTLVADDIEWLPLIPAASAATSAEPEP